MRVQWVTYMCLLTQRVTLPIQCWLKGNATFSPKPMLKVSITKTFPTFQSVCTIHSCNYKSHCTVNWDSECAHTYARTYIHTWFGVHFRLSIGQRGPVSLQKTRDIEWDGTRWHRTERALAKSRLIIWRKPMLCLCWPLVWLHQTMSAQRTQLLDMAYHFWIHNLHTLYAENTLNIHIRTRSCHAACNICKLIFSF